MRGVSTVLGAAIAIILIAMAMIPLAEYLGKATDNEAMMLRAERERLDLIPYINGSSICVAILNPGPVDPVVVRYVLVRNLTSGEIIVVYRIWRSLHVGRFYNITVFNTTSIYGRIDVVAVTLDGGVFHLDPEYVGGDGVLDPTDVSRLASNSVDIVVNPSIGWALQKNIVIRDGAGNLHYLIPYSLGNATWSSGVAAAVYNTYTWKTPALLMYLSTPSFRGYISGFRITITSTASGPYAYIYAVTPAGSSYLVWRVPVDGNTYTQPYWGYSYQAASYTNTTTYYTMYYSAKTIWAGTGAEFRSYIYGSGSYGIWFTMPIWYKTVGAKIELSSTITAGYKEYLGLRTSLGDKDLVLGTGGSTTLSSTLTVGIDYYNPAVRVGASYFVSTSRTFTVTMHVLCVVNPAPSYNVTIHVPYKSYDVYQPTMTASTLSQFIRPSDQYVGLYYQDYLLPGTNYLVVNATVPEMYRLAIDQPSTALPDYWVLVSWLDPRLCMNISGGGPDLLLRYGLVRAGATVSFLYDSVVFYNGVLQGEYVVGGSLVLGSGVYAVVPLDGPYRGNVFYLYVDNWVLIEP